MQFSSRNFISFEMMMVFWTHPQSCIPKKEVKVKLLASSESSPLEVTKTRFRSWWLMNINEWGLGHSFRALSEIMNKISLEPNQPRGDCAQSCNTVGVTRPMHHTCIFHICTFYTHLPSWLARLARIWNSSARRPYIPIPRARLAYSITRLYRKIASMIVAVGCIYFDPMRRLLHKLESKENWKSLPFRLSHTHSTECFKK